VYVSKEGSFAVKSRVFVGSSGEGKKYADAIVALFGNDVSCHPWHQGVFELSGNTQASLLKEIGESDFTVIVLTADDETSSRGKDYFSPRDNLIFEAGISFGALHSSRTFLIPEGKVGFKMPSDLGGFTTTASFDSSELPKDAMAAPVAQIRQRIQELGRRPTRQYSGGHEKLNAAAISLLKSAHHTIVLFGRDLSWASAYAEVIKERVAAGVAVDVFSDLESKKKARANSQLLVKAGAKVHYCERDPGIKLSLIDHREAPVCQFMISFKERDPAFVADSSSGDKFLYQYTIHDARQAQALWLTLVRLYESFKSETATKRPSMRRAAPRGRTSR
jgi:hypothetical protein